MSGGIVSGAAVRNQPPDPDDWALVVRPIGGTGGGGTGVNAQEVIEATVQRRFDVFVSDVSIIYVGYAALGEATSSSTWRIKRITFALGNPTSLQWSGSGFTAVWDDRTTISYS